MSLFTVQITPLIRPGDLAALVPVAVAQFADLDVTIALNDARTGTVTLSIHDPVVASLAPFAFAVRILYEDRLEPVLWGPSNIIVDYAAETCVLDVQDPSIRLQHHYVRSGDTAINNVPETDQGTITVDHLGLEKVVEAAQNIASQDTRNDPSLGLIVDTISSVARTGATGQIIIERGQECWQIMQEIAAAELGPDFDMRPDFTLSAGLYSHVRCHNELGTDRTSATPDAPLAGEVVLDFGLGADNLVGFTETPGRPTTHAHVLDDEAETRVSRGSVSASGATGVYVDWVAVDYKVNGATDVLQEVANARVAAYGVPPRFLEVILRPDAVIEENFGNPSFTVPTGKRSPTFYLGDYITVRALRGARSYVGDVRVVGVNLMQAGANGLPTTVLKLVPLSGDVPTGEEL